MRSGLSELSASRSLNPVGGVSVTPFPPSSADLSYRCLPLRTGPITHVFSVSHLSRRLGHVIVYVSVYLRKHGGRKCQVLDRALWSPQIHAQTLTEERAPFVSIAIHSPSRAAATKVRRDRLLQCDTLREPAPRFMNRRVMGWCRCRCRYRWRMGSAGLG